MSEKNYSKREITVYVCERCGKEWDVPGAAESCYNTHLLMDALEDVQNHKKLYIEDVIEVIEEMAENGWFDYDP